MMADSFNFREIVEAQRHGWVYFPTIYRICRISDCRNRRNTQAAV